MSKAIAPTERQTHTSTKGASTAEYDIGEETFAKVQIDPVNRIDDYLMYAGILLADKFRVEEDLRRAEPFRAKLAGRSLST